MATSIFSIVLTMSTFMQLLYQNSFVFILALQYRYNMSVMDTSINKQTAIYVMIFILIFVENYLLYDAINDISVC